MLQEENTGEYLHDFGAGKLFFKKVQKNKNKKGTKSSNFKRKDGYTGLQKNQELLHHNTPLSK